MVDPEPLARVTAMLSQISRADAWDLLCEWTESDSLRRHMLAVEAAMRSYAPRFDGDVELWGMTGLMHDLDYERYPNLGDGHPRYAIRELEERGYPPELVRAVASHADFMGVSRDSPMEKTLYAVDELSGFILAVAYVRPEGLVGMTPKSVKKRRSRPRRRLRRAHRERDRCAGRASRRADGRRVGLLGAGTPWGARPERVPTPR
jgi:putative nucleotidyltransferase with HDIG domain